MFEQFSNSIKATLYDRVSSPLSSSFFVSWCLWNYKILIVLFSSMKPYEKYNQIDILISNYGFSTPFFEPLGYWLSNGFLLPLASAAAYLFIYPKPSRWVYEHWLGNEKKLKKLKDIADEAQLLSEEESKRIRKSAFDIELRYIDFMANKEDQLTKSLAECDSARREVKSLEKQMSELNDQCLAYRKQLEVKVNELNELNGKVTTLNDTCKSLRSELLEYREKDKRLNQVGFKILDIFINASNNIMGESSVMNTFRGAEKVRAEDNLSEFIKDGVLEVISGKDVGLRNLKLTAVGREYYKSNI
ncbi:hypothetical protein ACE02U_17870 [Shewanella xiamenensis]|uniref:hypothetical protein n=1 Tax=Shewanella xiamenensis TaxID=332186 RepID=UPI0035B8B0AD